MLRASSSYFAHSDTGRARRANEDAYFARSPVFVVADGMGGAQAGEVASRVAIEAFERGLDDGGATSAEQLLADRVQEANTRIHEMSQASQDRAGMGTTITAAHVGHHDVAVAHVGDSRAYLIREGQLSRITNDHSWVFEQVQAGMLTEAEAEKHPLRNVITRALGGALQVNPDASEIEARAGDVILLCSDGLTGMVPENEILRLVTENNGDLQKACQQLIDAANERGGLDNVTAVLVKTV